MKTKVILSLGAFLLCSLLPAISKAQFNKGDKFLEGGLGSISFTKNKMTNQETGYPENRSQTNEFSASIFPRVGFFISNNVVLGGTLGLSYTSSLSKNFSSANGSKTFEGNSRLAELDIIPFLRYYFRGKGVQTRFYGQVGGGVALALSVTTKGENYTANGSVASKIVYKYPKKPMSIAGELLVGVNHFVSQNVALNAAIGYSYKWQKMKNYYEETYLNIPVDKSPEATIINKSGALAWNVGFTMFIPCKKKK